MAKAVLISIRPEWVEKIANYEKTIEIRKTKPDLETPFKCYIYCTNKRPFLVWGDVFRGDWFTEFTRISGYSRAEADKIWDVFNGRVAGEFICDRIYDLAPINNAPDDVEEQACLTQEEICQYLGGKGYAWHISKLEIYDTPKSLSEFTGLMRTKFGYAPGQIKRPPQSWRYVRCEK